MAATIAPTSALIAATCALALGGCGQAVSTSAFKGEEHEVAQVISNLQSDVSAGEQQKICSNDLASAVVARLDAASGGCQAVIKEQLSEIDSATVAVDKVTLAGAAAKRTAKASVRSIYSGKTRASTVSLVKEQGKWKVSAVS
jgi:hypothetical protein